MPFNISINILYSIIYPPWKRYFQTWEILLKQGIELFLK